MDITNFKAIRTYDFSTFSINTLEYYIHEADKILANMKTLDPEVLDIVDKLHDELAHRG